MQDLKGRNHLADLGVDRTMWAGFMWLQIGSSGWLL